MAGKFEFTREKTRGTIKVTIPLVDINEKYKEILKENISKIKMKGFRPGHVPTSIIEKQFGEQFKFDAINDILQKEYKDYIDKENIDPISQASLNFEEEKVSFDKDVVANLTFELPPYIQLGDISKIKTDRIEIKTNEKDVEKEIEDFRQRFSTLEEVDTKAEKDDFVDITAKAFDENGELLRTVDRMIKIGEDLSNLHLDDHLIGLKKGESKKFDVTYDDNVVFSEFKNKKVNYDVAVNSVKKSKLPDLTDEFVQKNTRFTTVDEYKSKLKERLEYYSREFERKYNLTFIYDEIAKISDIEIPDTLVEQQAEIVINNYASSTYGLSRDKLETMLKASGSSIEDFKKVVKPSVVKDIEIEVILDEIIKQQKIELSEQDWNELKEDIKKDGLEDDQVAEEIEKNKVRYEYYLKKKKAEDYILATCKTGKIKTYTYSDIPDLQVKLDMYREKENKTGDEKKEEKPEV
ncbi:MAG TPA: trigger factor [Exilispira sp.]|nr:trigger factor [Exilispira sp.]